MITVDNVLLALWTRHSSNDYDKVRDKPLWMLLQRFIEERGGFKEPAIDFDVTGKDPIRLADRLAYAEGGRDG